MNAKSKAAPSFVKASDIVVPEDKLDAIRKLAARVRDIKLELDDMEQRQEALKEEHLKLTRETIPNAMDEVSIDKLGLPAEGNMPAFEIVLGPFYRALIAADWPQDKRNAAFAYLESLGEGDLIKTEVAVKFPREDRKQAVALAKKLAKEGFGVEQNESVHFQTLTAWLKAQIEDNHVMPDLDKIGGFVGRVANLKARKK